MSGEFTIGVDLGGTNLRVAALRSGSVTLFDEIHVDTGLARGRAIVVKDLCAGITTMLQRHESSTSACVGIAIGSPGPLELPAGILRNPPNLKEFDGFNLREAVEQGIGRAVLVESDANVAALAELHAGAGRDFGVDSLCMLTLGTGAGNGIVLDGRIWHGMNGMGGEGGHIVVEPEGDLCGCGGRGCLERYASATAISRIAGEMGLGALSAQQVAELAEQGDPTALLLFERLGRWIALAVAALVNTLNLPLYVLGGGVASAWHLFSPSMFRHLNFYSYVYRLTAADPLASDPHLSGKTYVLPAVLGSKAGLVGACLAARGSGESGPNPR